MATKRQQLLDFKVFYKDLGHHFKNKQQARYRWKRLQQGELSVALKHNKGLKASCKTGLIHRIDKGDLFLSDFKRSDVCKLLKKKR